MTKDELQEYMDADKLKADISFLDEQQCELLWSAIDNAYCDWSVGIAEKYYDSEEETVKSYFYSMYQEMKDSL